MELGEEAFQGLGGSDWGCKILSPEVREREHGGEGPDGVLNEEWPNGPQRQKWPVWRMLWTGVGVYTKLKLSAGKPEPRDCGSVGVVGGVGIMALALLSFCLCLIFR